MITVQKTQKYFQTFQLLTMITQLELGKTDGVILSLVSINVWRLAADTLNITCNFLYCNHQVHRYFLITLYINDTSILVGLQCTAKQLRVESKRLLSLRYNN
jgi:hypothetical protein